MSKSSFKTFTLVLAHEAYSHIKCVLNSKNEEHKLRKIKYCSSRGVLVALDGLPCFKVCLKTIIRCLYEC